MKRLRLVLSGTSRSAGGTQGVAASLQRGFASAGWDVDWFGPESLARIRVSRRYPGLNEAFRALAVRRALARLPKVDLTLSNGIYGMGARGPRIHVLHGTYAGLATACAAGLSRLDYLVLRWLNGLLEGRCGHGAVRTVVSRGVGEESRRFYGLRADHVVHNGVDVRQFCRRSDSASLRRKWNLPEDRFLILVVGRLDYGKGWQAVRSMHTLLPDKIHMVLVAPSLGGSVQLVPGRMTRIPTVEPQQLTELYAASDLLLCPSLYEGFGLTLIEAWACCRPVVSTTVGFLPELQGAERSLDEALATPGDAESLAAAVCRMADSAAERVRQAEWGYQKVHEQFSLTRCVATYLTLADNLAGAPHAS
jgi:glycosyltransferase involved in cell wall biosynthesis